MTKYKAVEILGNGQGEELYPLGTTNPKALYRELRKFAGLNKRGNKSERANDMKVIESFGIIEFENNNQSFKFQIKAVGKMPMTTVTPESQEEFGAMDFAFQDVKAKCSICNKVDKGLVNNEELGLVHEACLKVVAVSQDRRLEVQVEKGKERRSQRRYKELNLMLVNAIDEVTANYEMWIEPSIYEPMQDMKVCACCGLEVEDNPLKIIAGDDKLHVHINCMMKDCMKSPDFQALLFWESLGFKLSQTHLELLISAMASGNVLAAYSHAEKVVPDVRHMEVNFRAEKPKVDDRIAIPVAAYDEASAVKEHRRVRNACRTMAGLPPVEEVKQEHEVQVERPPSANSEDFFLM